MILSNATVSLQFTCRRRNHGIHFKAIVVNISGDPNLDALYGKFRHSLISDIKELPDKLLRIYGAMTRM